MLSLLDRGLDQKTLDGGLSEQVYMQLLERRHSYLNRKVKKPLIRLWDKEFQFLTRIEDVDRWMWEELATEDGSAEITFSGSHLDWLRDIVTVHTRVEEDLHITIDPDPDNPTDWRNRWGGKVIVIEDDETAGEASRTTLKCISHRRHLRGIYLAANPTFPVETQIPKMYLWGGPAAFACASSVFVNLLRLYTLNGWYAIPRNVFAPDSWLQNLSPLNWPVQVMPINPVTDQSRWCTIASRWKDAHTVLTPVMKDAGVICRAYTWLPGDPAPYTMFGDTLAEVLKPTRACIILSFEDKSGVTGPTGTALDGGLNLMAATLDDLITETILPIDADGDGETDPFFRKLLLVAPKPPPIVYRDVGYGNVKKKTRVIHKSQATDIIVGGKSPQWVNQAITFAIRYGIAQLEQVISGGPLGGAYQVPGTSGLDNLYQGQLDDVFLAFQRYVNPIRSAQAGSYAFREHFATNTGTAYVINAIAGLAAGDEEMRAYSSMKFDIGDGPYVWGQDYTLGDRVGTEIRGVLYADQILAARGEGTRELAGDVQVSFGDDRREENPIARGFREIANVGSFVSLLAGSGDVF
jgi:hypothetical protein